MVLVMNANLRDFEACSLRDSVSDGEGLKLYFDCGDELRVLILYADCGDLVVEDDSLVLEFSEEFKKELEASVQDVIEGRTISLEELEDYLEKRGENNG